MPCETVLSFADQRRIPLLTPSNVGHEALSPVIRCCTFSSTPPPAPHALFHRVVSAKTCGSKVVKRVTLNHAVLYSSAQLPTLDVLQGVTGSRHSDALSFDGQFPLSRRLATCDFGEDTFAQDAVEGHALVKLCCFCCSHQCPVFMAS